MKQRLGQCPYQEIKEAEEGIERSKRTLHYMEGKTRSLEKSLRKAEIQTLYEIEGRYQDGFCWDDAQLLEVPTTIMQLQSIKEGVHVIRNCPFIAESCEDVLALKLSRGQFLRRKITQMTSYYNELMAMIKSMLLEHERSSGDPNSLFVSFQKSSRPCLIYFDLKGFTADVGGDYRVSVFYFNEQTHRIVQEYITCYYERQSDLLKHTHLLMNETARLIQVKLPKTHNQLLQRQIIHGIEELVRLLNHKYGKRYGKIQGIYLWLPEYTLSQQMSWISELRPLGYQVLGQMIAQGKFTEQQILIHLLGYKG